MTVRSFQDHVRSLIGRRVAESKVDGAPSPDVEARAVLESVALNLLLKPRAILYLAHLARNGLLFSVNQELAAIDSLIRTVNDLANVTFATPNSQPLERARTALLQMESLERVNISGGDFQRFSKSIDEFLNKSLAKNVRRIGSPYLVRSSSEAAEDLPVEFAALKTLHTETVSKLLLLSVGVENFLRSSLGTVLGLTTAYRAREDIEEILSVIENGAAATQLRDIAVRLIGSRAALKSVGSLPSISDPLIDGGTFPIGHSIRARTAPTAAVALSNTGPFAFSASASASVTVDGVVLSAPNFPQSGTDLNNRAFVVSSPVVFPVTVPNTASLFIYLTRSSPSAGYVLQPDGSYLMQVKVDFTAGPIPLSTVLSDINTELGVEGTAVEYVSAGSNRISIIANAAVDSVSISPILTVPKILDPNDFDVFTESAGSFLGFQSGQVGLVGSTPTSIVVDALNAFFGSLVVAGQTDEGEVSVTTVATEPGVDMAIVADAATGLTGTYYAESSTLTLFGTAFGVAQDPIDPTPILDVGDIVSTPYGAYAVQAMTSEALTLGSAVRTFSGAIEATSALTTAASALDTAVQNFMPSWLGSTFGRNLTSLDRIVAMLSGKITSSTRNEVNASLSELKVALQGMRTMLETGPVPSTIGTEERTIVNGIITTLEERRYDRALSLLLTLDLTTFLEMTGETASFGGNVLKAMSDLATTDVIFPNTEEDEDSGFKALVTEPEA